MIKLKLLFIGLLCYETIYAGYSLAKEVPADKLIFNESLLELDKNAPQIDLSFFKGNENTQPPGIYWVSIYVNEQSLTQKKIMFVLKHKKLQPQLPVSILNKLPLKPEFKKAINVAHGFVDLEKKLPFSKVSFDFSKQKLNINIPQKYLINKQTDISKQQWDEGINAFLLNYDFTGNNGINKDENNWTRNNDYYLNLQLGLNYQNWRLRSYVTWNREENKGVYNKWDIINTYLESDVPKINSRLILGHYDTTSIIFDNFPFIGVNLSSNLAMLSDRELGYAPIIRGIANTDSLVSVYQYNKLIYQIRVSAGPFEINDLYNLESNGDLTVEVKGYDGSINKFVVPFMSLPNLEREGHFFYNVSLGRYGSNDNQRKDLFIEDSLSYGLPYNTSIYGGLQLSHYYQSMSLGLSYNIPYLGAISFQVIQAYSHFDNLLGKTLTGQAYRILFSKSLTHFGTNFQLAEYRYATPHFYSFPELEEYYDFGGNTPELMRRKKNKIDLTINQAIPHIGNLYLNSSWSENYNNGYENFIQAGFNSSWHTISYSINFSRQHSIYNSSNNNSISFSINIPLSSSNVDNWLSYFITIFSNKIT